MDLIELGGALSPFFDQGCPSPTHDELTLAFRRAGLSDGDPRRGPGDIIGKAKRVRQIFVYAQDYKPDAGLPLAQHLVSLLRSDSAFIPGGEKFVGLDRVEALRRAFRSFGFDLDTSGALRRLVIDNLTGSEMTEALESYVRRANLNPDDAPLQVGNGKDLDEAAARHVLEQLAGGYSPGANFPVTLAQAFIALNLSPAPGTTTATLDPDPHRAVQQCLYQLGCAVNRVRNEVGTGHGHPSPSVKTKPLTAAEGRLVARSTALVTGMLLDSMK